MSVIYTDTAPLYVDSSSRRNNGTTVDTGAGSGALNRFVVGKEASGAEFHAQLRFATGAVVGSTLNFVQTRLKVKAESRTVGAATYRFLVWAANFTTPTPVVGDYNKAYNNTRKNSDLALRVPLGTLFASGGTISNTVGEVAIPSRFMKKGGSTLTDLEVRTYVPAGDTLPANANITLYGTDVAVGVNRPYLTFVAYTQAELAAENPYRKNAVGATAWVGFSRETNPGEAMKVGVYLDVTSHTLEGQAENLQGDSLNRNRVRPRKVVVGRAGASGGFSFLLTPEKWTRLLPGLVKLVGSTDVSALYGGGNTGLYEHHFRVADIDDIKTFTFATRRGTFRQVYPGTMLSSLSLSANLDQIVSASVDAMSRAEWNYDPEAAGINDSNIALGSAGYDTVLNSNMSFAHAKVSFGADIASLVTDRLVQSFTINMSQSVQEKRVIARTRDVAGHYPQAFSVSISFDMYFENEVQMRKYLGDCTQDFPFKPGYTVELQAVELAIAGAGNCATGFYCTDGDTPKQEIIFKIPQMLYTVASKPVNGDGAIMISCSAVAVYDESTSTVNGTAVENGAIMILVRNQEAPAAFADLTSDVLNLITVKPAESIS